MRNENFDKSDKEKNQLLKSNQDFSIERVAALSSCRPLVAAVVLLMSSSVNYDDLYEEFVRLTSSPRSDPRVTSVSPTTTQAYLEVEYSRVTYEINESLDRSPLKVLTPPSPIINRAPPPSSQQSASSFKFSKHSQTSSTSSEEYILPDIMCDSNQVTSPNIAASSAGNASVTPVSGGKQIMSVEPSPVHTNLGNGQPFMPGILPNTMLQQTPQNQQNQNMPPVPDHSSTLGNVGISPQHHQQQPPHHQMHSMQGNGYPGMQHQLSMETHNYHHPMHSQMNLPHHQHGAHQLQHGPPYQSVHQPLPHAHNQQQYVPFGMQLSGNNVGNGSACPNHQMHPFHHHHHPGIGHHHQIPNQQPAHAMNMMPSQQACFMQHAYMHYQQNSQPSSLVTAPNTQRMNNPIGWMNGPSGAITNQNVISTTNHNAAPPVSVTTTQSGGKKVSTSSTSAPKVQTATLSDPSSLPGGLEVLWRELPSEYQKLLHPQDIPESAKLRGYFTVCELLVLKRLLQARYKDSGKAQPSSVPRGTLNKLTTGGISKGEGQIRRGPKRSGRDKGRASNMTAGAAENSGKENGNREGNVIISTNQNITENCAPEAMQEDSDQLMTKENVKQGIDTTTTPVTIGVGEVVKEVMDALSSSGPSTSDKIVENMKTESSHNDDMSMVARNESDSDELVINEDVGNATETNEANSQEEMDQGKGTPASELTSLQLFRSMPALPLDAILFGKKCPVTGENMRVTSACSSTQAIERNKEDQNQANPEGKNQFQFTPTSNTDDSSPSTTISDSGAHASTSGGSFCAKFSTELRYSAQVPSPYRTSTLVIKLLQIGTYQIRSFSSVNPNRFRVLFNSQRMVYECQLPVTKTATPDSIHPQLTRRVLTIDIGFDQISVIRFGPNSLWMRVEGAPMLTISTNPAQDEEMNDVLSPHDQFLLEQIEKGQLKLSPIHQLFFLNERLVQLLASQFRVHPRFRHLLADADQQ